MVKSSCSPNREGSYTCLNEKELKDIANSYNKSKATESKGETKVINTTKSKRDIWVQIKELNFSKCKDSEFCWLKQNYMKVNKNLDKFKENFRPAKPEEWDRNPNQWLNTFDILYVMNQYQSKYPDFKFAGVFPIDFADKSGGGGSCISPEMCSLDLTNLKSQGIKQVGFVFNLDKHYQGGSHWVALYMNVNPRSKKYGAYFYDSYGKPPPREVSTFIKNFFSKSKKKPIITYNKVRHQYENSECGVFSIYFLNEFLKNKSFETIVSNKNLNDKYVFKYRNQFFTQ